MKDGLLWDQFGSKDTRMEEVTADQAKDDGRLASACSGGDSQE